MTENILSLLTIRALLTIIAVYDHCWLKTYDYSWHTIIADWKHTIIAGKVYDHEWKHTCTIIQAWFYCLVKYKSVFKYTILIQDPLLKVYDRCWKVIDLSQMYTIICRKYTGFKTTKIPCELSLKTCDIWNQLYLIVTDWRHQVEFNRSQYPVVSVKHIYDMINEIFKG